MPRINELTEYTLEQHKRACTLALAASAAEPRDESESEVQRVAELREYIRVDLELHPELQPLYALYHEGLANASLEVSELAFLQKLFKRLPLSGGITMGHDSEPRTTAPASDQRTGS